MWSDNDIDNAFQRLNPPEPDPAPFPLDAWLRLETQLDQAAIERAVRRKMWKLFAAEMLVVALVGLGWLLWPANPASHGKATATAKATEAAALAPTTHAATAKNYAASTVVAPAASAPSESATASPTVTAATGASGATPFSGSDKPVATAATPSMASSARAVRSSARVARVPGKPSRGAPAPREGRIHRLALPGALAATDPEHRTATVKAEGRRAALLPTAAASATPVGPVAADRHSPGRMAPARMGHKLLAAAAGPNERLRLSDRTAGQSAGATSLALSGALVPDSRPTASALAAGTSASAADNAALLPRAAVLSVPAGSAVPAPLAQAALTPSAKPDAPVLAHQPRFYLGLVGAPDLTTVKFTSVESPLPNLGVVLEYRLGDRLRITTGLLRSTKQYKARRADYDFGDYGAYLTHRYFDDVDGTCTVLDVPLNLRYDLVSRPHYALYGSAGLSSFFMLRERYAYAYTEYNKPGYWSGEVVNANRHLLSILNLSAGYERALSTRWSLHAEPYVKLPLAGVGAGKLKLTSAGVFLGVKYGF